MKRIFSRTAQLAADVVIMATAFIMAYCLRFDGWPGAQATKHMVFQLPYVVSMQVAVFWLFGIYAFIWRYVGAREIKRFFLAAAMQALVLLVLRLTMGHQYLRVPLSVIVIDFSLVFMGSAGIRFLRRLMLERNLRPSAKVLRERKKVFLVGAGQAGLLIAKEVADRPDFPYEVVGFLDDDPMKHGGAIHGLSILGSVDQVQDLAAAHGVSAAIITIANARGGQIRRIRKLCQAAGLETRIIPPLYELVGGRISFNQLREVSIEDLLGRESVDLDRRAIRDFIRGKRVMITGAGGSIGSELVRQIHQFDPAVLVLAEQAENALFLIHRELVQTPRPGVKVVPVIVDVCDSRRVDNVFEVHKPQIVFHAAAHKHVPMMEMNPGEAVKNNIFGTKKVADACDRHAAEVMVMISTDKAVNPTSVMGASKRAAELYIQTISQRSATKYMAVRFGNVLGSAGSVIPIFKDQIAHGGPVMVTHPDMKRYFMTIPEAVLLVMQSATFGKGGEIFILDMGEPVKILDLAKELVTLSGLRPYEDIDIVFTGIRPGEKLFEELNTKEELMSRTLHNKIFIGKFSTPDPDEVMAHLRRLDDISAAEPREEVLNRLKAMIPEFISEEDRVEGGGPSSVNPGVPLSDPDGPLSDPEVSTLGNA